MTGSIVWAGATPSGLLATRQWQKVGSLQPILVFCPCPNPIPRHTQPLCFPTTSHHPPGDAKGEAQGDDPVSCTLHPSTTQIRLKLSGIRTPLLLKRPWK